MTTLLKHAFFVAAFTTLVLNANAQYTQFATNPVSLLFGVVKLETEIALGSAWAVEAEGSYITRGQRFWSQDYNSKGFRAGVSLKRYLVRDGLNEGLYGFAYLRHVETKFTDFTEEGAVADQRDFNRLRTTFGFGLGWTRVGRDRFTYGFALGVGRHFVNDKRYTTVLPGQEISRANDDEVFELPFDVYGRVSMGIRLYTLEGQAIKDVFEEEEEIRLEQLRDEIEKNYHQSPSSNSYNLEMRRLEHRVRNGNG